MPRKPKLDVNSKQVREEVQNTKGHPSHIGRPSRATGRRAERIAAKQQGKIHEMPRAASHDNKKTAQSKSQGRSGARKVRKAA
jgi:hypothetical protein